MARVKSYKKNIACLESLWDENLENRLTVRPILQIAATLNDVQVIYLTCNTVEEFKHNLVKLKRRRGYGVLYLSLHGSPGEVHVDDAVLDLESLAALMGKGFQNWILHFGSCGTVDVPRGRLQRFIAATGVALVVGYRGDVVWVDSAALDLLLLDWAQAYKDMRSLWNKVRTSYRDLVRLTGMQAFHP